MSDEAECGRVDRLVMRRGIEMYDVLAVDMNTHKVELLASNKSERNADAIVSMAVLRRGCDSHFYTTTPCGRYADGDEWSPDDEDA